MLRGRGDEWPPPAFSFIVIGWRSPGELCIFMRICKKTVALPPVRVYGSTRIFMRDMRASLLAHSVDESLSRVRGCCGRGMDKQGLDCFERCSSPARKRRNSSK